MSSHSTRTRPSPSPARSRTVSQCIVAFVLGAVPLVVAAISGIADLFAAVPDWIVPVATIIGTLTTGLAALWARQQVTPTALPRLADDVLLVPMVEREET
jgi:hypothetical protein